MWSPEAQKNLDTLFYYSREESRPGGHGVLHLHSLWLINVLWQLHKDNISVQVHVRSNLDMKINVYITDTISNSHLEACIIILT